MDNYFKFNEIGQIMSILKKKFNLFKRGTTMYERRPLYKKQSKVDEIDASFFTEVQDKSLNIFRSKTMSPQTPNSNKKHSPARSPQKS